MALIVEAASNRNLRETLRVVYHKSGSTPYSDQTQRFTDRPARCLPVATSKVHRVNPELARNGRERQLFRISISKNRMCLARLRQVESTAALGDYAEKIVREAVKSN
jgi:hypothetical protein